MDEETTLDKMKRWANKIRGVEPPPAPEVPRHLRHVKTQWEYQEEERKAAEAAAGRVPQRDTQTHKLVPDSVFNYGQD